MITVRELATTMFVHAMASPLVDGKTSEANIHTIAKNCFKAAQIFREVAKEEEADRRSQPERPSRAPKVGSSRNR
jgi:hypothetical protein